jgi:hypothetical protein
MSDSPSERRRTYRQPSIIRPDTPGPPHRLGRMLERRLAIHSPSYPALQLRLERLDGVDGDLGRDTADTARHETRGAGDFCLVWHAVPVSREEPFLGGIVSD